MSSPTVLSLTPVPAALSRGVYSYVEQPSGETVYYAVTSMGDLLNGELRRRGPEETEAIIVREMWRDLNRQDSVIGRPPLSLVVNQFRQQA